MGMRWAARTDANHKAVMKELRQYGCSVADISRLKGGIGDLLVGCRGVCYLFELKDPAKVASARKETEAEVKFGCQWKGQRDVIHSAEEALAVIRREERRARGLK